MKTLSLLVLVGSLSTFAMTPSDHPFKAWIYAALIASISIVSVAFLYKRKFDNSFDGKMSTLSSRINEEFKKLK